MRDADKGPTVSAIIIFLNSEKYLDEAIRSALAQTFRDFELLLVDDGSTDGSTAIAKRHAAENPDRVRYLEHPGHVNRGMSASRNLGIRTARGEFIAFLDSDDIWLPRRLERHVEVIRRHPEVGMVYGPTLYWFSWSPDLDFAARFEDSTDFTSTFDLPFHTPIAPPAPLISFLRSGGGTLPGICSLLARAEVVRSVGGFEEAFRGAYEDQVFLSKMVLNTTVLLIDEVLDYYRQHTESHCYVAIDTGDYHPTLPHPAREKYLLWLESYLEQRGNQDRAIWAALRKEIRPYRYPRLDQMLRLPREWTPLALKATLRSVLPHKAYNWLREAANR
jgi:glycosyltransferase involved in cell wall biosynthesis